MKRLNLNLLALTVVAFAVFGCKNETKEASEVVAENTVETTEIKIAGANYTVDTEASTVKWKGYKPTGSHHGTVALKDGGFTYGEGKVQGGTFTMDMSSITDADGSARLEGHLKSADFFDVEKWPTAKFEVTGMNENDGKMSLNGNLTLKDATHPVSVPVTISAEGESVMINSDTFTIDRSKWNVRYGSKSFFDDLGDKFINDEIELTISVKGNKAY